MSPALIPMAQPLREHGPALLAQVPNPHTMASTSSWALEWHAEW